MKAGSDEKLLPEDVATLRSNYIHHWGLAYVAGKSIPAGPEPLTIEIAVPGTYTVEAGPVIIDGQHLQSGELVKLGRGAHKVGPRIGTGVVLRWGENLPRTDLDWPKGPIWTDF